jgi:GH24 family phage-related lysozyme (muramidase)
MFDFIDDTLSTLTSYLSSKEAPASAPNPHQDFNNVDFEWIKGQEGYKLKGYVPTDKEGNVIGHSGVTVASGFDLGSRSKQSLEASGLSDELVSKLMPFAGLRGEAAKKAAENLNITDEEGLAINKYAKRDSLTQLDKAWMKATGQSFKSLPKHKATPIADLAFNHGVKKITGYNFWKQVTNDDWVGAEANLRNFGEKDPLLQPRRTRSADYFDHYNKKGAT